MKAKLILLITGCALASNPFADQVPTKGSIAGFSKREYSPYAGRDFPTHVYCERYFSENFAAPVEA